MPVTIRTRSNYSLYPEYPYYRVIVEDTTDLRGVDLSDALLANVDLTGTILGNALRFAGLVAEAQYELNEVGRVYSIDAETIRITPRTGVKLSDGWTSPLYDSPDSWDRLALAEWMKDAEEDEKREWLGGSWDAE